MALDLAVVLLLQANRFIAFDIVSILLAHIFSTTVLFIFGIVLLFIFLWKKNPRLFLIPFSLGTLMISVKILKELFARTRPDYALPLPMLPYSQYSFPSGHTAAAFLLAFILSKQYPKHAVIFYGAAVLTAISRLYLGLHYSSDVIASIFIGLGIGWICMRNKEWITLAGGKIIKFVNSIQKLWLH